MQIGVHEPATLDVGQFNVHRSSGEVERVSGDGQEVDVAIGNRTQPAVLELPIPPDLNECTSPARHDLLGRGYDGVGIEEDEVSKATAAKCVD